MALELRRTRSQLLEIIDKYLEILGRTDHRHCTRFFSGDMSTITSITSISSIHQQLRCTIVRSCSQYEDADGFIDMLYEHIDVVIDQLCNLYEVDCPEELPLASLWAVSKVRDILSALVDEYIPPTHLPLIL